MTDQATKQVTQQRTGKHGELEHNSRATQRMLRVVQQECNWPHLPDMYRHSLYMILHKVARIACGDPHEVDHWRDIAGYAEATIQRIERGIGLTPHVTLEVSGDVAQRISHLLDGRAEKHGEEALYSLLADPAPTAPTLPELGTRYPTPQLGAPPFRGNPEQVRRTQALSVVSHPEVVVKPLAYLAEIWGCPETEVAAELRRMGYAPVPGGDLWGVYHGATPQPLPELTRRLEGPSFGTTYTEDERKRHVGELRDAGGWKVPDVAGHLAEKWLCSREDAEREVRRLAGAPDWGGNSEDDRRKQAEKALTDNDVGDVYAFLGSVWGVDRDAAKREVYRLGYDAGWAPARPGTPDDGGHHADRADGSAGSEPAPQAGAGDGPEPALPGADAAPPLGGPAERKPRAPSVR